MFDRKTFLSFFSLYGSLLDKFILSFSPCSPELINRLHLHHSFYFFLFLHSSVLSFPSYRSKCFSESDIDSSSSGFDSPSVELDLTDAFTSGRFSASRVKDKLATTISVLTYSHASSGCGILMKNHIKSFFSHLWFQLMFDICAAISAATAC